MKQALFTGVGTAIVTPFKNGAVNFPAFGRLIDRQLAGGVHAIIVCGHYRRGGHYDTKGAAGNDTILYRPCCRPHPRHCGGRAIPQKSPVKTPGCGTLGGRRAADGDPLL